MFRPRASSPSWVELESAIAAQRGAITEIERELWDGGLNEDVLDTYQGAFRRLERMRDEQAEQGEIGQAGAVPEIRVVGIAAGDFVTQGGDFLRQLVRGRQLSPCIALGGQQVGGDEIGKGVGFAFALKG